MQIHYRWETYTANFKRSTIEMWIESGTMELIETKPCEITWHFDTINGHRVPMWTFLWTETGETKPEEKPTELEHRWQCIHSEFTWVCCDECYDHDKAMEIPEVPEFHYEEYAGKLFDMKLWDSKTLLAISSMNWTQIEELTKSVALLIKAHNNK